ncbi:hypothetical protein FHY55_18805 [Oceanicola sp. D3]|uniref:lysozyme inhibitor LprI family protein n=1 Tax=Oceanicola sp. D3 TaxID=2587163 RepID=UPI001122DC1A|nr:lysozyme inhibitor LprI family protein [Oceanicola sp. D3]QDC11158.1 hypothetical protein FHY55_18805 [Oceanicola sp. D3]
MRRVLTFAGIVAGLLALAAPGVAQEIKTYGAFRHAPALPNVLVLNGQIKRGATFDLRKALREHGEVDTLFLISPGGDVHQGLELSAIVFDRALSTVIPPEADCASACSFLFVAGKARRAYGRLGVHQFTSGGAVTGPAAEADAQSVAAQIFDYLKEYDVPSLFMVRMLETPSDRIYWFPPDELRDSGIETFSTFGPELEGYAALPGLAEPPAPRLEATPRVPVTEPRVAAEPDPAPAPDPAPRITRRDPDPSFNCDRAGTPTEYAICGSVELADLDKRMASLFYSRRGRMSAAGKRQLDAGQRDWLAQRNGCGASVPCLRAAYSQRIAALGG